MPTEAREAQVVADVSRSTVTIVAYADRCRDVLAAYDRSSREWAGDPFAPPALRTCVKTRSGIDVIHVGESNPGTEQSWDAAGASFITNLIATARGAGLLEHDLATYRPARWSARAIPAPRKQAVLSWYQTAELPKGGGSEPALDVLARQYQGESAVLAHVRALDVGRRVIVFDLCERRISAMRLYQRICRAMRRHGVPVSHGDILPVERVELR